MILSWLVARHAVTAKGARGRSLLLLVIGAVSGVCVIAGIAAAGLNSREDRRAAAMVPVEGGRTAPGVSYAEQVQAYRTHAVRLVRVNDDDMSGPLLPGGVPVPRPGEVLVSPALAALMSSDTTLRSWFPQDKIDVLPRAGIGAAGQLLAYVGVGVEDFGPYDQTVVGFGSLDAADARSGLGWYPVLGFLVFLVIPGAALILTSSRFGRETRTKRFRALRLLGMRTTHARLAVALEVALPVALGATLIALGWPRLISRVDVIPIVGRRVFVEDARLSWAQSLTVVLLTFLVAALLGAVTATGRPPRANRLVSQVRLTNPAVSILLVIGVTLAVLAWERERIRDPLLGIATLLIGIGLPSTAALLGQRLARLFGRLDRGVLWLLVTRRLAADPQSRFRIAGIVGIAVFVVGSAHPVARTIAQPSESWTDVASQEGAVDVLGRADSVGALTPLRLRKPVPAVASPVVVAVGVWEQGDGTRSRPATTALIATCPQLRVLVGDELADCRDGRMRLRTVWRGQTPDPAEPAVVVPRDLVMRSVDGGRSVPLSSPAAVVTLPQDRLPIDAAIVLPPDDEALLQLGEPYVTGAYVRVPADRDAWEATRAWIVSSSPAYRFENQYEASETTDRTVSWMVLGLAGIAALAGIGALLSVLEDAGRRRDWLNLRATGASRGGLTSLQAFEAGVASVIAVGLAFLLGELVLHAYLAPKEADDAIVTAMPSLLVAVAGVVATIILGVVSSLVSLRTSPR